MNNGRRCSAPRQHGLALITVLMIFAIVSVLGISMVERQAADIQRSGTLLAVQQANAFVIGAEQAVKTGLYLDWNNDKERDHALEEWATDRRFPLSPGTVFIRIRDAQGRFNLNTLSKGAANRDRQYQRFVNLLNLLALDPALAERLLGWLDDTSQEDTRYQSQPPPYRAAYQSCRHTSEILLLEGMTLESYRRLEPYIACLPLTAALNVNTASAAVLAALDASLTLADGDSIVAARGDKGFASLDEFWGVSQVTPFTREEDASVPAAERKPRWEQTDFSVKSEYFEAFIRVDLYQRIATSEVLIRRDQGSGKMTTLYRDYSRREARPDPAGGTTNNVPASAIPAG